MTERENALNVYRYGKPQWIPCHWKSVHHCDEGIMRESGPTNEKGLRVSGEDLWGVKWIIGALGEGYPTPDPRQKPILEDITQWRDVVKFPDVDAQDWEGAARKQAEVYDGEKLLTYFDTNGMFNRLTELMGHENALCAMLEEPEECYALFGAIADVKIQIIEHAAKYLKPDVFCYMDDMAAANGLMFSPDTYRELLKDHHARIIKAIKDNGMIAEQHICGKWDIIMDDLVEIGIESFLPAQPTNDLNRLITKYPHIVLHGTAESQSPEFSNRASWENGVEEARKCINTYGKTGKLFLYISTPMKTISHEGFFEEAWKLGHEIFKKD